MRILVATGLSILAMLALVAAAAGAADPPLQVHLPRSLSVETDTLTLGTVGVVQARDEELSARAAQVPMGRAPWPKEEIAIDRTTILARLASCGIPASQVKLTGAEKVVVGRSVQTVKADDLVKVATEYVQQKLPGAPGGQWRLVRTPKDVTVPAGGQLLIEPRLVSNDPVSLTRIEVSVSVAGRQAATDQVHFKTVYPERKAVATCDIPAGAMLTPENVEIRTGMSDRPEPADWRPPYGQVAAEAVKAGTPVRGAAPKPPPPPEKTISRSDSVMMKIQGEGFVITALGQALDDGRPGGFIRVRNVDSSRIVVAKVMADGCVEPVISGVKP